MTTTKAIAPPAAILCVIRAAFIVNVCVTVVNKQTLKFRWNGEYQTVDFKILNGQS